MINNKHIKLTMLSVCHLLVDGICATVLMNDPGDSSWVTALLLYNTLAFTTQCLTGQLPDKYGRGEQFILLSALIMAPGALLPLPLLVRATFLGLGNSLFHVSGGYITLKGSKDMGPLGIFVAPGAVGLFLGGAFPWMRIPFMGAFLLLAGLILWQSKGRESSPAITEGGEPAPVIHSPSYVSYAALLLVAIGARALGGSAVSFPWKNGLLPALLLTAAVFLGKSLGGLMADHWGIRRMALLSIPLAILLGMFCEKWMVPSLLGQWALNISMPITLYLLYKIYPDSPGFAFGLAASALWPGVLLGIVVHPHGFWASALLLLCLGAGFFAIYITERRLLHEKN